MATKKTKTDIIPVETAPVDATAEVIKKTKATKKPAATKQETPVENKEIPVAKKTKKAKAAPLEEQKESAEVSSTAPIQAAPKKSTAKKAVSKHKVLAEAAEDVAAEKAAAAPVASKVVIEKADKATETLKVTFQLKYSTYFGQSLYLTGNHETLGNNEIEKAFPMQFFNHDFWYAEVEFPVSDVNISYNYCLVNEDGAVSTEQGLQKVINPKKLATNEVLIIDTWNGGVSDKHSLFTEPAEDVHVVKSTSKKFTHTLKVKAPSLPKNYAVFIAGNTDELGNWTEENIKLLSLKQGFWAIDVDLSEASFPVTYKYGVYNTEEKKFVEFEAGDNRILYGSIEVKKLTIISDGFIYLPNLSLKVAV